MSEGVSNDLIYAVLQKMQGDIADIRFDVGELKTRATAQDEHLANLMLSMSGLNRRMDRLDERLARVERRLDLTDAH